MTPTQEQIKRAYEVGSRDRNAYQNFNDTAKKAYWQYAKDNNLVDPNTLSGFAKTEYDKYINAKRTYTEAEYNALPLLQKLFVKPEQASERTERLRQQTTQQNIDRAKTAPGAFGLGFTDAATLNTSRALGEVAGTGYKDISNLARTEKPKSYIAGQIAGYVAPGAASLKATAPLAQAATKGVTNALGKRVIEGAIAGVPIDVIKGYMEGERGKDLLDNVAYGAAFGAAGDVALYGLGKALSPVAKSIIKKIGKNGTKQIAQVEIDNMFKQGTIEGAERQRIWQELDDYYNTISYLDEINRSTPEYIKAEARMNVPKAKEIKTLTKTVKEVVPDVTDKDLIKQAKKQFGTTTNPIEAGYLLEDGSMLDFSGRRDGGPSNVRYMDHREVQELFDGLGQSEAMAKFMDDTGSIRISVAQDGNVMVDITGNKPLSQKQISKIKQIAARKEYVTFDYYGNPKAASPTFKRSFEFPNVRDIDGILQEITDNKILRNSETPSGVFSMQPKTLRPNKSILSTLDARVNKPYIEPTPAKNELLDSLIKPGIKATSNGVQTPINAQAVKQDIIMPPIAKTGTNANMDAVSSKVKPLSFPETISNANVTAPELKKMIENNPLSYEPINNTDTLKYAQSIVDKNFEAAKALVKDGDNFANATEAAMAQDVIRRMQIEATANPAKWSEVFEVMETASKKYKTAGQTVQSAAMWNKMTPDGMLVYTQRVFEQANEVLPPGKKIKLSPEYAQKITETMTQIQNAPDETINIIRQQAGGKVPKWVDKLLGSKTNEQLKDIAIAQVLADIGEQVPSSAWRKVSSLQAMSHLLNVKTILRNILGNTSFSAIESISNTLAVPVDMMLSKSSGKRSIALPQFKGTFKAGADQAKESLLDVFLGIDRTGVNIGKYNVPTGRTFKKGIGSTGEKTLRYVLNVPDEFAKGQMYSNVLKQQMKAAKATTATKEMMEYAQYRAAYATFQDNSLPARILQGTKDLLNNIGGGKRMQGASGIKTREFGAGDLLVKYTRVPGNIISRTVEYTPAGLLKLLSIGNNAKIANKQAEMAMTIARAATGTSMIGLGVLLNRMGLLQAEDKDRSKSALALDRAEGLGNYKVNISALNRILDGDSEKPRKGDELYSYNWLEPVAKSFAIGASIDNEIRKGGSIPEVTFKAGATSVDEMLDLPTLVILRKMTYQDNVFDVLMTPITESASGFVPAPMRQYAQLKDPIARETKGENPLDTMVNRLKSNIPSVRESLQPRISPFGEEIKYSNSILDNLVNPGQKSVYNPSDVTAKLNQLEDATGETRHYPQSTAPKALTFRKEKIELTPEEKTKFMKISGEETMKQYVRALESKDIESLSDIQRQKLVDMLSNINSTAREKAKMQILKSKGLIAQ